MKPSRSRGFTLIELMIVVGVVAILAAIAYPSYTSSVLKGRRAQGRTALAELMQQQERFTTQRNCYMAFTTAGIVSTAAVSASCGFSAATLVPFKNFSGDNQTNAAYSLMADACSDGSGGLLTFQECVRVIAVPTGNDPAVGALRITSTGTKDCTAPGSATNSAGITPSPANLCWP